MTEQDQDRARARTWLEASFEEEDITPNDIESLAILLAETRAAALGHDQHVAREARVQMKQEALAAAKAHRGAAERRRRQLGQKLGRFEPEAQADIIAEERGEDIAAYEIAEAITALPDGLPAGKGQE